MEILPIDVVSVVARYLSVDDLFALGQTSRFWHDIVSQLHMDTFQLRNRLLLTNASLKSFFSARALLSIDLEGCTCVDDDTLTLIARSASRLSRLK